MTQPNPTSRTEIDVTPMTVDDLAFALDNSTPYPIELRSDVARFMAERLLEMMQATKRPAHAVWQPEEPIGPGPAPSSDPEEITHATSVGDPR